MAQTSLFKYVNWTSLKWILSNGIRFTQPSAFNDPFELLPELCIPAHESEKAISISFDIAAQRRSPPVGELVNTEGFNCSDINSRNILAELNESIGIFCLAKNSDSLLMWAHYADQYAGAVVEFDVSHEFFSGQIEVEYRAHRPRKNISSYLIEGQPIPLAELCSKSAQWAYEGEVRVIRRLADCTKTAAADDRRFPVYVQKVPPECIKEVTLGERTSIDQQREIWELVKDTEISLSLAAVANWGYEFRREKIKFNVPFSKMSPLISPRTAHIFSHLPGPLGDVARHLIKQHPMSEFVNKTV